MSVSPVSQSTVLATKTNPTGGRPAFHARTPWRSESSDTSIASPSSTTLPEPSSSRVDFAAPFSPPSPSGPLGPGAGGGFSPSFFGGGGAGGGGVPGAMPGSAGGGGVPASMPGSFGGVGAGGAGGVPSFGASVIAPSLMAPSLMAASLMAASPIAASPIAGSSGGLGGGGGGSSGAGLPVQYAVNFPSAIAITTCLPRDLPSRDSTRNELIPIVSGLRHAFSVVVARMVVLRPASFCFASSTSTSVGQNDITSGIEWSAGTSRSMFEPRSRMKNG